jgi:hypothetical protein
MTPEDTQREWDRLSRAVHTLSAELRSARRSAEDALSPKTRAIKAKLIPGLERRLAEARAAFERLLATPRPERSFAPAGNFPIRFRDALPSPEDAEAMAIPEFLRRRRS